MQGRSAETSLQFEELGKIASGGMGTVSLAQLRTSPPEYIAVKRLHPHLTRDLDFVRMFIDEVWMTRALHHPNVVQLVGWGHDAGGPYLAMEFIDGAPLSSVAQRGRQAGDPFSPEHIAFLGLKIASGLQAAHELRGARGEPLNIVHRDVSPGNVLLGFDGCVKITDFGVAKATAGSHPHTATGVLKGKIPYLAPEYARGRPVDCRCDLYSLGVLLFELACGKHPFIAVSDLELLRMITQQPAPKITESIPNFDKALAALVDRLLQKDPNDRPPTAEAVRQELTQWLQQRGFSPDTLALGLSVYVQKYGAHRRQAFAAMMNRSAREQEDLTTQSLEGPTRKEAADALTVRKSAGSFTAESAPQSTRPLQAEAAGGTRRIEVQAPGLAVPPSIEEVIQEAGLQPATVQAKRFFVVVAALVAFGFAGLGALVVVLTTRNTPAPQTVQDLPTLLPSAPSSPAEVPETPPSSSVAEEQPSAPESTSSAPSASPATRKVPILVVPPKQPQRSCTPRDFDYPRCLKTRP